MRRQAARDWDCDQARIEADQRGAETWVARGCDRAGVYHCAADDCVNLTLLARDRGAREFGCELDAVRVEELSYGVYRAHGCGRESTYFCDRLGAEPACVTERVMRDPTVPTVSQSGPGASSEAPESPSESSTP